MKNLIYFLKYLMYLVRAKTPHGIHSPFIFELANEVIYKKSHYYPYDKIEYLRKRCLISSKEIDVTDLGTGKSGKRSISQIAERSLKNKKHVQLLFRLVYYFSAKAEHPSFILELGTSLGITACYLASANSKTKVITIEGCPQTAHEAKKNFQELGLRNMELIVGNFDTILPGVLAKHCKLPTAFCQLVFFDGNHRKEPTLNYFNQCFELAKNDSVFVFDDIHGSDEMEEAWETIKSHPKITVTIDLFFMGLVFFRKEQAKQHFVLRY